MCKIAGAAGATPAICVCWSSVSLRIARDTASAPPLYEFRPIRAATASSALDGCDSAGFSGQADDLQAYDLRRAEPLQGVSRVDNQL
jgi:hypothetical protein